MPALQNARHERFAQNLAKGMSQDAAYEAAGYKANRGNASTLASDQNVSKRVAELSERAADAVVLSKSWVIERLIQNVDRAMQVEEIKRGDEGTGEYKYDGSVANKALELLGKEIGMFVDRKEIRTGALDDLDAEQRTRLRDAIDRELDARKGGTGSAGLTH